MAKRRAIWLGIGALLLVLSLILGVFLSLEARRDRAAKAEIQATFQQIRHDLPVGTPRTVVVSYLKARKLSYQDQQKRYRVFLGSTPDDSLVCREWSWSADIDFDDWADHSRLAEIKLSSMGICL